MGGRQGPGRYIEPVPLGERGVRVFQPHKLLVAQTKRVHRTGQADSRIRLSYKTSRLHPWHVVPKPREGVGPQRLIHLFSTCYCASGPARHVINYKQTCGLFSELPKNGDEPKSPLSPIGRQHDAIGRHSNVPR